MLSFLTRYLKAEIHVTQGEELREGPALVEGVGQTSEIPLRTPFRGKECLTYVYRVVRAVQTRGGAMPSVVRERLCRVPFRIVLTDGVVVEARPKKVLPGVTADEHRETQSNAEQGIYFDEEIVEIGRQVRVQGMLRKEADGWCVFFEQMEDLGPGPTASGNTPRRRRKKGRAN